MLAAKSNAGYGAQPLPSERDNEIGALLLTVQDPERLEEFLAPLTGEHVQVLVCFAERMATLAVRQQDRTFLNLGLVATVLAGLATSSKDALLVLPLQWDAASRLGLSPDQVFREIGARLGLRAATFLEAFLGRSATDKSISSMGYRAELAGEEFRYVRDW